MPLNGIMRTVLKSDDFEDLVQITDYADNFVGVENIIEIQHVTEYKGIKGKGHNILLDGIHIDYNKVFLPRDCSIYVEQEHPHLEMHFELSGNTSYSSQGTKGVDIDIRSGYGVLFYLPDLKGRLDFAQSDNRCSLEIELTVDFLRKIFNDDLEVLGVFGSDINKGIPSVLGGKSFAITPAMKQVINDIMHCPYTEMLKKVYLESKVIELLTLKIAQYNSWSGTELKTVLRKEDIEKIYFAKEIIQRNIQEPFSLLQLSEQTGLNDFKLKKGFKELFGTTVFGYLNDIRMEQAKMLILEGVMSIAAISEIVGYKNPQHFTVAFKKKHGFLPKDLRKR